MRNVRRIDVPQQHRIRFEIIARSETPEWFLLTFNYNPLAYGHAAVLFFCASGVNPRVVE